MRMRSSWSATPPSASRSSRAACARPEWTISISAERRTQNFYADVAENVEDDAVSAFAAEMAADENRHVERLERLLAREPLPAALDEEELESPRVRKAA